jgi:hypothetical protein
MKMRKKGAINLLQYIYKHLLYGKVNPIKKKLKVCLCYSLLVPNSDLSPLIDAADVAHMPIDFSLFLSFFFHHLPFQK